MSLHWRPQENLRHGRGSDVDIGSEDLVTVIARVVLSEGDQPNVLVPNFDNPKNLVRKELESECVCQTVVTVNFLRMKCIQFNCKWLS